MCQISPYLIKEFENIEKDELIRMYNGVVTRLLALESSQVLDKYDEKILEILGKKDGSRYLLCSVFMYFKSKTHPVTREFIEERLERLVAQKKAGKMTEKNSKGKLNTYYFIPNYFGE